MSRGISQRTGGFIVVVATTAFALLIYAQAATTMSAAAGRFPKLLVVLLLIAAVLELYKTLRLARSGEAKPLFTSINWKLFGIVVPFWLLAIALLDVLGFYPVIFCFQASICWIMSDRTRRSALTCLPFAGLMTLILWCVFSVFLKLTMPSGML